MRCRVFIFPVPFQLEPRQKAEVARRLVMCNNCAGKIEDNVRSAVAQKLGVPVASVAQDVFNANAAVLAGRQNV